MKVSTIQGFANTINNGTTFVSIDTLSNVTLTGGKKNEFQGRVQKRMTGARVEVGASYERKVQKRLVSEGKDATDFELQPRKWGVRMGDTPIIEHTLKDGTVKHYLEVIFQQGGNVEYLVDGEVVDPSTIPGLPESRGEAEQGGLSDDGKVVIRTFDIGSITEIRAANCVFR